MRYLNAKPSCKVLGALFVYLMAIAHPVTAEELRLMCKTKKEANGVFVNFYNSKENYFEEYITTRYGSNITLVVGNGKLDDKNFLWPRHDCIGNISEKFSDTEIYISCDGVKSTMYGKSPSGYKSITVNRMSGDILASLNFKNGQNYVMSIYEGNCKKAKQKF
jgi:hypothetical protein